MNVRLEALGGHARVVRLEYIEKVVDVAGGQAQRLDLGQLRITRHVGDAVAQRGERGIDGLGAPALLLV